MTIRVVLVDDDGVVRQALGRLLRVPGELEVIGVYASAEELLEQVWLGDAEACQVALVDLKLPGVSGLELIGRLGVAMPSMRVVALTNVVEPTMVSEVLAAGAVGYLGKDVEPDGIRDAIRAADRGLVVTSIAQVRMILRRTGGGERASSLDRDETRLLELVADGATNAEIAELLHFSESTVKHRISALMRALDVRNRVELARQHWDLFR